MTQGEQPPSALPQKGADRRAIAAILTFLFWTAAFAVAYTQWPLYSENQNTKFLHGLAAAGVGTLNEDWLANTIDPLPAFTLLVQVTARFFHRSLFYLYQALLLGLYLFSLVGIADSVFDLKKTRSGVALFSVLVIALHASLVWPFSMPLLGTSLGWLLQAGVANQYLFNPVFQPASFGVLLLFSIYLYLRGHPVWASSVAALAAVFHSTYLPGAGMLTLAYMLVVGYEERSIKRAAAIGLPALAIVAPVLLFNAQVLNPTSPEMWARAQAIIVNDRIPHHSLPAVWLDRTVYVKMGIVALALAAVRRSRLFPVMLICAVAAVALTWVQMRTGSDLLAFIAPWRMSVFLVPLSTSLLMAWVVAALFNHYATWVDRFQTPLLVGTGFLLLLVVVRGAQATQDSFAVRNGDGRNAMYDFVGTTQTPGAAYLTPVGMADFRLATGVPVVVTWKSHPYKDVEVIEWKERIDAVNGFYSAPSCEAVAILADRYSVTHLLFEGETPLDPCAGLTPIYRDDRFLILALAEAS